MTRFENKIDFVAIISVENANANGDPLNGNRPRTDYEGYGEMSDVCIKRKIRNRMQDMSEPGSVFVQSQDRADDGATSLANRSEKLGNIEKKEEYAKAACEKWIDVRTFGQVFAFDKKGKKKGKDEEDGKGVSVGVRGPVSIHQAISVDPVDIISMQITKSVNGKETKNGEKAPDTIGSKHFVKFGVYKLKGSINVQLAEKTGFSVEDADLLKECLRTLFVNDCSAARPDGSMEVVKLYWFKHNCKDGQYSSRKVHDSVEIKHKDGIDCPAKIEDYEITLHNLEGLDVEEIEGV